MFPFYLPGPKISSRNKLLSVDHGNQLVEIAAGINRRRGRRPHSRSQRIAGRFHLCIEACNLLLDHLYALFVALHADDEDLEAIRKARVIAYEIEILTLAAGNNP